MPIQEFNLKFNPNPLQKGFIESRARADLFSSRRGEGKSTGLAWSIFYHTRHNPTANWAVVRDTFENLQKTTQKTFFEWFPPGIAGEYHATKKEFKWASGLADGTVSFVGMDNPKDASKFLSWELGGIAFDEPAPAAGSEGIDELVFDLGSTCLRQPNMNWYSMKLAENNPDESHWTYRKFVDPGMEDHVLWQPAVPENLKHLPATYYEDMRKSLQHRPDLVRRFVDGEFGFQQEGQAVTPQWSDKLHLATGLVPQPGRELQLLWDFGHNPTCIITQRTSMGYWFILDAFVGEGIGVEELILDQVKPTLVSDYGKKFTIRNIGDPTGATGDQSSIHRSAVRVIRQELGGHWVPGPVKTFERIDPLQAVLSRTLGGRGLVQVDRQRAQKVWWSLRGGWHYHKANTGVISSEPKKNIHSHPGDAMGYGAARLFPLGRASVSRQTGGAQPAQAKFFEGPSSGWRIGPKVDRMPANGEKFRG